MREPRNFDKRIDTSDRHDVGNFDHSYNSGVNNESQRKEGGKVWGAVMAEKIRPTIESVVQPSTILEFQ